MIGLSGYTGLVGGALLARLKAAKVIVFGRTALSTHSSQFTELQDNYDFGQAFDGIDTFIHAAARVHVMHEQVTDPLTAFREVNTAGTLNLARQAAAAGVKRFIFISSIKVNGESTTDNQAFRFDDMPNPEDPYGISKAEAEVGLKQIATETNMEVVIIRPPLVYGPGVKANFAAMLNLAKKNLPLPLGAIHNKRSLVALDNLVDLIVTCIDHPKAANQTFLVSDDKDVSTTQLLQMMTLAAGKKPRLVPVPISWLKFAGKLIGKQAVVDKLCGNLQVDISHTKTTLGWAPPITVEEGIKRCFIREDIC
jgi:nucleoside-diphosphate-sugar epimerase